MITKECPKCGGQRIIFTAGQDVPCNFCKGKGTIQDHDMNTPTYTHEKTGKQTHITFPDGRPVFCDECGDGFDTWDQMHVLPSMILHPYPDDMFLCKPCASAHQHELNEEHERGREAAIEKGHDTYYGWSV